MSNRKTGESFVALTEGLQNALWEALMQGVADKPKDGDVNVSFARVLAVVHDPERQPSDQSHGNFGIDWSSQAGCGEGRVLDRDRLPDRG